ncbi:MAG: efflux RND transporter periplasmic adaptor subunit [Vitreoscilla sp.]|nr:efflux RND transporter periplasmic adaptor subunit [Vitreoscilla sp.]MBP6674255.1 efflux RND transporter periplasmic adaptor subunit [Vitreoscilla sp.]
MKLSSDLARRLGLGLLAALLLGAIAFVMLRSGPLAPIRVTVAQVSMGSFTPSLFGIGTVEARRAYLIGPTAAGRVRRLLVDVGDSVKAGQLLAEMDPVDLDERLTALDASLARGGSAVAAAQAQRQDAVAKKELATLNARRYEDLGEKNFISTGAVEAKLQEQTSANAALSAADANLAAARQDLQRLGAERAGLQQQRNNVRLLAPADGVVTSRDAEAGSTVVAGQAVLRVIEPSSLWVRLRLDQGRSAGLTTGLPAQIVLRSRPGQPLPGTVARVEAQSDSVTEERIAQVSFGQIPVGIAMGELAEVTLQTARPAPALLVPNAAIKRRGEQSGVWRLSDGHPVFAPVRTGLASLEGQVQVLDGLKNGDEVVVYSEKELAPQSRVKVVDNLTKAAP